MAHAPECWKTVTSDDRYEVSSLGRVRRRTPSKGVRVGRVIRSYAIGRGYRGVKLGRNNSTRALVHRLVAREFCRKPPGWEWEDCRHWVVNHINGVKNDNRVENLEWVTQRQNLIHCPRCAAADSHYKAYERARYTRTPEHH